MAILSTGLPDSYDNAAPVATKSSRVESYTLWDNKVLQLVCPRLLGRNPKP